ncbi:unnamed protein product [Laminaria digitata]
MESLACFMADAYRVSQRALHPMTLPCHKKSTGNTCHATPSDPPTPPRRCPLSPTTPPLHVRTPFFAFFFSANGGGGGNSGPGGSACAPSPLLHSKSSMFHVSCPSHRFTCARRPVILCLSRPLLAFIYQF